MVRRFFAPGRTLARPKDRIRARRFGLLLCTVLGILAFSLGTPERANAQGFVTGYNQAWIGESYGHDLSASFDAAAVDRVMQSIAAGGGQVVRMWLFEGRTKEGVIWQHGLPADVDPAFLRNVGHVMSAARRHGLLVYWTGFDGNWFWDRRGSEYDGHWNILNERWGAGDAFREYVLGPVLDQLTLDADIVYGLDLINEVQGMVATWDFTDGWAGARTFLRNTARFADRHSPWLAVTASSGHHTGVDDLLAGRFSGLGLDFFDVHVYSDTGRIPKADRLARLARRQGLPMVLGEFGQSTARVDDALQARVTAGFLIDAWRHGFKAALGWRFDDERRSASHSPHHSYLRAGRPRLAVRYVRWLAPLLRRYRP
ncbi:MAG: hypothetical protein ACYS22_06290 [Planctomycetota bacterium]|jgi:hypothetical protein